MENMGRNDVSLHCSLEIFELIWIQRKFTEQDFSRTRKKKSSSQFKPRQFHFIDEEPTTLNGRFTDKRLSLNFLKEQLIDERNTPRSFGNAE
jgi:hypothetical protein